MNDLIINDIFSILGILGLIILIGSMMGLVLKRITVTTKKKSHSAPRPKYPIFQERMEKTVSCSTIFEAFPCAGTITESAGL